MYFFSLHSLFELVNSEQHIIQSHLIIQFITVEQFERAKQVYFNMYSEFVLDSK